MEGFRVDIMSKNWKFEKSLPLEAFLFVNTRGSDFVRILKSVTQEGYFGGGFWHLFLV